MKKVMVTGADGFIGSHLTEHLLRKGFKVKALSLYNAENGIGKLKWVRKSRNLEIVKGDIRDLSMMTEETRDCDGVVNMAALIGIPYSYISVRSYIDTNIIGVYNMLESALKNKTKHLIIISSSETYGTAEYTPIDEMHPLKAQSPYAATKIAGEELALSYFRSFDLPVSVIKPFNVYGPRQSMRSIIPSVINQVLSSKEIKVGNVDTKRDFMYVDDVCEGICRSLFNENGFGQTMNLATGKSYRISEIIDIIKKIGNSKLKVKVERARVRSAKSEVMNLQGDWSKARELIGFKPRTDIHEGLFRTFKWFSENREAFEDEYVI
ncbi:MAG: SDR family NAD(P)-dependent oxidoreductase [bacterium]